MAPKFNGNRYRGHLQDVFVESGWRGKSKTSLRVPEENPAESAYRAPSHARIPLKRGSRLDLTKEKTCKSSQANLQKKKRRKFSPQIQKITIEIWAITTVEEEKAAEEVNGEVVDVLPRDGTEVRS